MVMVFGVSNSFKRGTVKTYARSRVYEDEAQDLQKPRKRICMAHDGSVLEQNVKPTVGSNLSKREVRDEIQQDGHPSEDRATASPDTSCPSSPPSELPPVFSSDPAEDDSSSLSSLPSSPPQPIDTSIPATRRPMFSLLKRKLVHEETKGRGAPLSEMTSNIQRRATHPMKAPRTQMRIDLGCDTRKTCRLCGMEYVPSVKEDTMLHRDFCSMNVTGIEMGKSFLKDITTKQVAQGDVGDAQQGVVVLVDRQSSALMKSKVKRVLSVVNNELSAEDIHENHLWGSRKLPNDVTSQRSKQKNQPNPRTEAEDRFRAFLHLDGDRCVGLCLAEKINQAFSVVPSLPVPDSNEGKKRSSTIDSTVSVSRSAKLALLGISRIWVSKSHRGNGLASNLLDCAQNHFFYGLQIPKTLIAFSQPTESGKQLAERWFRGTADWLVYNPDREPWSE